MGDGGPPTPGPPMPRPLSIGSTGHFLDPATPP